MHARRVFLVSAAVAVAVGSGAALYVSSDSGSASQVGCSATTQPKVQGATLLPCQWSTRKLLLSQPLHVVPPFVGAASPSRAPIVVQQGRMKTASPLFTLGRPVQCETFGRLLTVHVPPKGETTAQFWTSNGTHVFFYLGHWVGHTFSMCGAAKWFGGH